MGIVGLSGTRGAARKNALPSYVCLLDLLHFCTYGAAGEHPCVALDVYVRRVRDRLCVPASHALAWAEHVMVMGWIRPMVVMNVL